VNLKSQLTAAAGNYAYIYLWTWMLGTSPWRPGTSSSEAEVHHFTSFFSFNIDLASGALELLGQASKLFLSSPPGSLMDAYAFLHGPRPIRSRPHRVIQCQCCRRLHCRRHYHLHCQHHHHAIIVHPLFKQNFYFSLLCDWHFFSLKSISFSFLPSMQLKHVILTDNCC
jgi:hypothetical protein